jgi:hypothetical protein
MSSRTYLTSAEGLNVVDYLNGILPHVYDTVCSLGHDKFYKLASYYYDDLETCKSVEPASLHIIKIGIDVIVKGHCGYCSDSEDQTYLHEKEEILFVALPDELERDLSSLSDVSNFYEIDSLQCSCGGCREHRKITHIELV